MSTEAPPDNVVKKTTEENDKPPRCPWLWVYQPQAKALYAHNYMQVAVAVIIIANFLMNVTEKQIDPAGTRYEGTWEELELFFNIVFLIELLLNMYGHWAMEFWKSGWNLFDFVVVAIGTLDMAQVELPGPLGLLRMMRAFRVFRLFKRIDALNKILTSIFKAIPGVSNAFLIMFIVMSIYAVLATGFFRIIGGCGDAFIWTDGHVFSTSRELCYGDEYFGNFFKSLYTLFQVLTGDSWSEAVVRPILMNASHAVYENIGSAIFFTSFVISNSFILINIVVAVLLDKMANMEPSPEEASASCIRDSSESTTTPVEADTVNGSSEDLASEARAIGERLDNIQDLMANVQSDMVEQVKKISTILQRGMTL